MLSLLSSMRTLALRQSTEHLRTLHTSAICEAARKGTREKARKKKVKVEVQKLGFIPHNQRDKKINVHRVDKHLDDSWKNIATDNVYVGKYYQWPVYSFAEAIKCHCETHHPTMYNEPNAPLNVHIELNMQAEKSTRFLDSFQRMAIVPHKFTHGEERNILVFTKGQEEIAEAREAGGTLVGGVELIKDITEGKLQLSDYQFVIAHTNILPELVALRGLMKRKFPNPKSETLGTNLAKMIKKFSDGISYKAVKDEYQQNFALISACIGSLNMESQKLEDNLRSLLEDINSMRPKREGRFITKVLLISPPSREQLKINPFEYVPEIYTKAVQDSTVQDTEKEESNEKESEEQQKSAVTI